MTHGRVLLVAASLGIIFSAWLYGFGVLDPREYAWLLHGDPAQHLLGATHFLSQPWKWPPGEISIEAQTSTSIVFVDAVPFLALAAKLFLWPVDWQYFGVWIWSAHPLMACASAHLLLRLKLSWQAALIGAAFFLLSPTVLLRAYGHEALMAQWIILAIFICMLFVQRTWSWLLVVSIALLVHPYLGAMALIFGLGFFIHRTVVLKPSAAGLVGFLTVMGAAVLTMWISGYFLGASEISSRGFGFFSANALTWLEPMDWFDFLRFHGRPTENAANWSVFFNGFGLATRGQYEGFAYLGLGMIGLTVLAVVLWGNRKAPVLPVGASSDAGGLKGLWQLAIGLSLLLALFALSNTITFGKWVLIDLPLPALLAEIAGVFRASGRFIWPLTYLLMLLVICAVASWRWGTFALASALVLQLIDLSPKLFELKGRFHQPARLASPLAQSPEWGQLFSRCPNLVVVGDSEDTAGWAAPALRALHQGARVRSISVARPSQKTQSEQIGLGAHAWPSQWTLDTVYLVVLNNSAIEGGSQWVGSAKNQPPSNFIDRELDSYRLIYSKHCELKG